MPTALGDRGCSPLGRLQGLPEAPLKGAGTGLRAPSMAPMLPAPALCGETGVPGVNPGIAQRWALRQWSSQLTDELEASAQPQFGPSLVSRTAAPKRAVSYSPVTHRGKKTLQM